MKINYIQISNILSFKYYQNISEAPKILFDDDLNILIGQNGAGKSTCLEVINFIFKRILFLEPDFNYNLYGKKNKEETGTLQLKNILSISEKPHNKFRIEPNWDSIDSVSKIKVQITLDEIDKLNIENLNIHKDRLNSLGYTNILIPEFSTKPKVITIEIVVNKNSFRSEVLEADDDAKGLFPYLQNYHLYKDLIKLYNKENNSAEAIPSLQETFVLITSFRNYHTFSKIISLKNEDAEQQIRNIANQDSSKSVNAGENAEPSIFNMIRLWVAEKHYDLYGNGLTEKECEDEVNKLPFLISINERLGLINLTCIVKFLNKRTWDYAFRFVDIKRNNEIKDINSLSGGQKAIVHLLFEAYGRGTLKGGLVIIDEPEIHLHYQFQHEYVQIIKKINKEQQCQYVLVTHSETLINSETIDKIKRFSLDKNLHTVVYSPALETEQKHLIKILDNTRSTYAFFAKKIILTEGDTDRYFFKAFLQNQYPNLTQEIAVLDIGGKCNFNIWKQFFESFGLEVYFICDFDNVFSLEFSGETIIEESKKNEMERTLKQSKLDNLTEKQKSKFKELYNNLIKDPDFLDSPKRNLWKPLLDKFIKFVKITNKERKSYMRKIHLDPEKAIDEKYADNIFILKQGSIEDYIKTKHGDLSTVITFCREQLDSWIQNNPVDSLEIISILKKISGS